MNCVIEKDRKQFVDVVKLLPNELPSGKKILWKELENDLVEISVDKHSARGGNAKTIIIKRLVPINELLFEGLGLRFGDGLKIQGGKFNVFGFANTNLEVHKHFLKFSKECFGLESKMFNVKLSIPPKLANSLEEIKNKISVELNIPLVDFWKPKTFEKRNMSFIDIKIQSTLLGLIVNLLFENMKEDLINNQNFAACFLRGVVAGEANVHVRQEGRLGEILIACEGEDKRNFLRGLLLKLDIQPSKDKIIEDQESVLIHGLSNFKKVKEWNLCSLHPQKSEAFERGIKGFKVEQSRKGELRLQVLMILSEKPRTRQELGKLLNRSPATIRTEALFILEDQRLVERGEIVNKSRLWKITERGLKILKIENPLEILRGRGSKYESYEIIQSHHKISEIDYEQIINKIEKKLNKQIIADNSDFS